MIYNPFTLENKTVLVTGASSGIGRATAIECSKMGASLIITGRNEERLKETYEKLEGSGNQMIIADLKHKEELLSFIEQLPVLNGIVNNAGISKYIPLKFISEISLNDILSINTISPILLIQQLYKKKKIANGASIVFTSSISGVSVSFYGGSLYSTSKGAINGFMKAAALDLSPNQIRVNSVTPGVINTNILSDGTLSQEQIEEDKKKYPLGRHGEPEEVAYAIIYLLSDASKWVTGSNILIDGGFTLL
jgi:NAD(P)-dependent dehydrogenase (short-subunit alcohol dehydrogenase family)